MIRPRLSATASRMVAATPATHTTADARAPEQRPRRAGGPVPVEVSVVVPVYNEAELLERSIEALLDGLRRAGTSFELHVVENGSTDGTALLADRLAGSCDEVRVTHLPVADYGAAMREGVLSSSGEFVAVFDADYYDLAFLERALELMRGRGTTRAPDLVLAVKRGEGAHDERAVLRRTCTAAFTTLLRLGFGMGVSDTHGMKVMRRTTVVPIARRCRCTRDLFDTELVLRAERNGLSAEQLPVAVRELRPPRTSIVRRAARSAVDVVRLRVVLWRDPVAETPTGVPAGSPQAVEVPGSR